MKVECEYTKDSIANLPPGKYKIAVQKGNSVEFCEFTKKFGQVATVTLGTNEKIIDITKVN